MTVARKAGFTLLEVMVAVAILAIALGAVFSAEAGSVRSAQRARKLGLATLLVRCKMGEIEEDLAKKGLPAVFASGADKCCKGAEIEGFKCKWEIQPIVLPEAMFGGEDDKDKKPGAANGSSGLANATKGITGKGTGSGSGITSMIGAAAAALSGKKDPDAKDIKDVKDSTKDGTKPKDPILKENPKDVLSGDPSRFLTGSGGGEIDAITAMAMQFVYPVLKPAFQSQIRRATVTVSWPEGDAQKSFDVTQYVVAEQPVPLSTDPNDPNALLGAGANGLGTQGTSTSTPRLTP